MWRHIPWLGLRVLVLSAMLGLWAVPAASAATLDHSLWDQLLKRHVKGKEVDYQGVQGDRGVLNRYLKTLETIDVDVLPSEEAKLAFWINAYNAYVINGVLDHYPLKSVKDVDGFFERIRYRVANDSLTLNQIEGRGRKLGDWRIHFAVVCASSSCPLLREEAYVAERLEAQLAEQTQQFLADPKRGLRVEGRTLWLSKIFDWYKADFIQANDLGWLGRLTPEKLLPRIEPYVGQHTAQAIQSQQLSITFLDYDWSLNAQR